MSSFSTLTDLQLLDRFCEDCMEFINPPLFREIQKRSLVRFVDYLSGNSNEAKAIVRARLAKEGRFYGNEEIDEIAGYIKRIEDLRKTLNALNMADAHKVIPLLEDMQDLSVSIKDYFKPKRF